MEKLKPIPYDDNLTEFALERTPWDDDRLTTDLKLADYSWMSYELASFFPTKKYGDLDIHFTYFGFGTSQLFIRQTWDNKVCCHRIRFDTSIFKKYIVIFMEKHLTQWESQYAFFGGKIVVKFYNEVLENYIEYDVGPVRAFKKKERRQRRRCNRNKAINLEIEVIP